MASFQIAFQWIMQSEDPQYQYINVADVGNRAISGINSGSWPEDFADIAGIPQIARGPAVQQFYQTHFWNQWFDQLVSDDVAKRVFDAAVNMGPAVAVKLLQRACGVTDDGIFGPSTLAQANSMDSGILVTDFIAARRAYYVDIVRAKPELSRYLAAWLERASK